MSGFQSDSFDAIKGWKRTKTTEEKIKMSNMDWPALLIAMISGVCFVGGLFFAFKYREEMESDRSKSSQSKMSAFIDGYPDPKNRPGGFWLIQSCFALIFAMAAWRVAGSPILI
ncbi:hypothetical protein ACFB49_33050 [Sphingomonas sp. DBB INV C78]|uniref:hypothetical protein n=1 Tax=Sphingomonas sp. DBB INV C78 TaxID=3349434 RepID=UPI0036D396D2